MKGLQKIDPAFFEELKKLPKSTWLLQLEEIWGLEKQVKSLEYRLRTIASDPSVPEWVRDYAAGKKDQLQCDGT